MSLSSNNSSEFENLIFHHIQLKLLKRDGCNWCRSVLPNLEDCKTLLRDQGIGNTKLINQLIVIQEQPQGRVPEIYIRLNFPHASQFNYLFKHDNEDRTSCTLMTVLMYFATIIYPETYLRTKFSTPLLDLLLKTITLKRSFPLGFISLEHLQAEILDLRNTGILLDKTESSVMNDTYMTLYQMDDLDVIALFYFVNQQHTRIELLKNIHCNTDLIHQLHSEELRFRMINSHSLSNVQKGDIGNPTTLTTATTKDDKSK